MIREEATRDNNLYVHVGQLTNERGEIRSARPELFHQHNSNTARLQATPQITGELGGTGCSSMENGQALRVHMISQNGAKGLHETLKCGNSKKVRVFTLCELFLQTCTGNIGYLILFSNSFISF